MADSRAHKTADLTNLVGAKLGNYRLERVIGRGRMGVVYLAQDEALLRPTAIKLLSWSAADANGQDPVQWFLAEARLIARLNHPRVVQIYGAARHGDHCYIAMEYVPGESAEAMVARGGPLPPERATDALMQAASALHAAHRSGIVHRDVKPANLLMNSDGTVKLGDFGMALGSAGHWTGNAHLRVGTPYYTAPEVWRAQPATAASDIYSLGATYFHLLTGRPPYGGDDIGAIEQAHLRAPVPDPREFAPGLPASCAALVARALAKSPRDRHASAEVLVWDGRRVLQELSTDRGNASSSGPCKPARPGSPSPSPAQPGARTARPLPPAPGTLGTVLGFARRPFIDSHPGDPHRHEPLASVEKQVLAGLADEGTIVIALAGAPRSGRGPLCRALAAELCDSRRVLAGSLDELGGGTVLQLLCRAAGAADEGTEEARLDALVELLSAERRIRLRSAVVVLDGVTSASTALPSLSRLVAAALWTRAFKVVLGGEAGIVPALSRAGVDFPGGRATEIAVPPLPPKATAPYLRGWLDAALGRRAPPILVSPDAALLVSHRSEGAIERVNCIAENMLVLAAAGKGRVLTSWHAWAASDSERWAEARSPALPRRPQTWPSPEIIDVIDACRRAAGMPPWPRGPGAGA